MNIFRDPRWGRGQETFGEDPFLTAQMGVAFITGMQGDDPRALKTLATAKHFAVHSGPEAERHGFDARVSAHDLADTYLPQFAACVRAGRAGSVMAAYNRVNGEACVASPALLGKTLRAGWQFDGYVVGDCGAVTDSYATTTCSRSLEEAAAAALRSGTDLDCGNGFRRPVGRAEAGAHHRRRSRSRRDPALHGAIPAGAVRSPRRRAPGRACGAASVIESPAHLTLARAAAARSIVLLENRGGAAPARAAVRRLAVIGPTAENVPVLLANYHGLPTRPVTLLGGITAAAQARGVAVDYVRGARLLDTTDGAIADAVAAARAADVDRRRRGAGPRASKGRRGRARLNRAGDRREIELPAAQQRLLEAVVATGRPVIVVVTGGSAIALPWVAARAAALLYAWYPGAEGGNARRRRAVRRCQPGRPVAITLYRATGDLPPFERLRDARAHLPLLRRRAALSLRRSGSLTAAFATRTWASSAPVAPVEAGTVAVESPTRGVARPTRSSRSTCSRGPARLRAPPLAARLRAGRRWRPASVGPSTWPFARRPDLRRRAGAPRALAGDVTLAIGGRQPTGAGQYTDATQGVTSALALPAP